MVGTLAGPLSHRYRPFMRTGNLLVALGIGMVVVGVMVKLGWFSWFGHLPGDIRAEGERGGFYFPITSSIVISLIATLLLNLVARLFNDR
jgi:hypothetical protein